MARWFGGGADRVYASTPASPMPGSNRIVLLAAACLLACTGAGGSPPPTDPAEPVHPPGDPTVSYEPPAANALYADPAHGSDATGDGSALAPYQTLGKALTVANGKPAGPTWTIVLRGGTYREGELAITRDAIAIQRYRAEEVRLSGAVPVSGWSGAGPYTASLAGLDLARVTRDCATAWSSQAHPPVTGAEQAVGVLRDHVPLRRVAGTPGAGEYALDGTTLTVGDPPSGIEVVQRLWAIKTNRTGVALTGLVIEGYGSCALNWNLRVGADEYLKSAVAIYKDSPASSGARVENCTVRGNSGGGIAIAQAHDVELRGNAVEDNGWDGVLGHLSDRLIVRGNRIAGNNARDWANTVEAGVKLTFVHDGVVVDNVVEDNRANGLWFDQGCGASDPGAAWFTVARNVVRRNAGKGIFFEVSHHGVIASNVVVENEAAGIASIGSRAVHVWSNTLLDNERSSTSWSGGLIVVEDARCYEGDTLPGGKACTSANGAQVLAAGNSDHCEPSSAGPLANTCNATEVTLGNNLLATHGASRPLLNVEDQNATQIGAAVMVSRSLHQAFWRASPSSPASLVDWQRNAGAAAVPYATLAAFIAANPTYEAGSIERSGGALPFLVDPAAGDYRQVTSAAEVWGAGAPLPPEVLRAVGWPATGAAQPSPARVGAVDWPGRAQR